MMLRVAGRARLLDRARESGDPADLIRAEQSARGSLSLRQGRNGAALAILASSLLGQHRFVEALDAAERLLALDSTSAGARSMVGEIQLELGRYDAARRTFGMLAMRRTRMVPPGPAPASSPAGRRYPSAAADETAKQP